jgi:hypothetical protein
MAFSSNLSGLSVGTRSRENSEYPITVGICPSCGAKQWVDELAATDFGWSCEGEHNDGPGCGRRGKLCEYLRICGKNRV